MTSPTDRPEPGAVLHERVLGERLQTVDAKYKADRNLMLGVLALGILVQALLFWFVFQPDAPASPLMRFDAARAAGPTAVCPGDTLSYTIELHVQGAGVFDVDVSVWRVSPPATVLFSQTRRMVFAGAQEYTLVRQWQVPALHPDPQTGAAVPWMPGQYERRHAISTTSRATRPSFAVFPFSIKADCE